ncbi:DUF3617 domain-containing protein [Sphingopyxis sp. PET50]|uniref:DUF3617 domain-containing protein n=1 Tax=Sphingopyxis sp. PET50 TaxID=2976533 RepID=UPI0021AFE4A0|nr:DUF3617 domain-containing protein [Sphingopyxis sp. PET50]
MKKTLMLAIASSLVLAACGDKAATDGKTGKAASNEPAVKPQPGSWTSKIEVVDIKGEGVPANAKDQMNQMFAGMSGISVCLTPEAAAKEDIATKMSNMGAQGRDCTIDEENNSGTSVDFATTCKGAGGNMKIAAKGTSDATAQDVTMTMTALKADGSEEGTIVMRVTSARKGECGPGDITPPTPAAKS